MVTGSDFLTTEYTEDTERRKNSKNSAESLRTLRGSLLSGLFVLVRGFSSNSHETTRTERAKPRRHSAACREYEVVRFVADRDLDTRRSGGLLPRILRLDR